MESNEEVIALEVPITLTVNCVEVKSMAGVRQKGLAEVWNKGIFCRELSSRDREWAVCINLD